VSGARCQGVKKNCRLPTAYCPTQVPGVGDLRFQIQNSRGAIAVLSGRETASGQPVPSRGKPGSGVFLGDGEQLEGCLVGLSDPLFPAFDGVETDVQKPGEECLTDIERQANSPDFSRLERLERWRDFFRAEVNWFAPARTPRRQRGFAIKSSWMALGTSQALSPASSRTCRAKAASSMNTT